MGLMNSMYFSPPDDGDALLILTSQESFSADMWLNWNRILYEEYNYRYKIDGDEHKITGDLVKW